MAKLKIPNFKCYIAMPKGTSRTYYVPLYEKNLIAALWEKALTKDNPLRFQRIPAPPAKGRDVFCDDHRYTFADSLASEYRRLKSKYAQHEGLFDTIFPGDNFADVARRCYPDVFGEEEAALMIEDAEEVVSIVDTLDDVVAPTIGGSDADSIEDVVEEEDVSIPAAKAPVKKAAKKAAKKATKKTAPALSAEDAAAIEALQELKHIGPDAAAQLVAAGFKTVEDIAQTDPEELAEAASGLGKNEAIETVNHAVDLSFDESESDIANAQG